MKLIFDGGWNITDNLTVGDLITVTGYVERIEAEFIDVSQFGTSERQVLPGEIRAFFRANSVRVGS